MTNPKPPAPRVPRAAIVQTFRPSRAYAPRPLVAQARLAVSWPVMVPAAVARVRPPAAALPGRPGLPPIRPRVLIVQAASAVRTSDRQAAPGYVHTLVSGIAPQTIDKHGTQYWNGWRGTLSFSSATKTAMATSKVNCEIKKASVCTGAANGIDHIKDFATVQSGLPAQEYCDGTNHWEGVLLSDAQLEYNDQNNLRWSCTQCNSSKSGAKGLYTPPQHKGKCPGATCTL